MLNLKKVIASICVIAMVLTTVAFGATYTDVTEDSVYYGAVETLTKLGIVEGFDGEYRPEDGVTRAEMAALIARIQGYGDTAKGAANTAFTDVPSSHWASGYIANAAGMGIINGYGDGTFGPEDPVLYEQAIKMVMATLGYTPFAEKNGGYPTGYLAAAQRYDVSLAVANAAVGQEANRGTIAQILENALDTPLMIQSRWNTNGEVDYVIADGSLVNGVATAYKTLMSENLGYVKFRGILVDNGYVATNAEGDKTFDVTEEATVKIAIKDDYKTDDTYVVIGNTKEFLVGGTDAADYLGRSVIGYTKKLTTNKYELVSIAIDTVRNDELVIDFGKYADAISGKVAYYKDGAKEATKVAVNTKMAVVYNDQCVANGDTADEFISAFDTYVGTPTSSAPLKAAGSITLIDNDDVTGYDVAIVKSAATGVVKKVTDSGINLKKAVVGMSTIKIDEDDTNKIVKIYKDGEEIDAAELAEWDILSIYAAKKNANVIIAEVIGTQVIGTITSTKESLTSDDGYAYMIDGNWYDVATGYWADATIEISAGGTFYIDEFGKIAAFVEDAALAGGLTANYAYVLGMNAEPASFGGAGVEVELQIVTKDGIEIIPVKNNTKVKGASFDFDLDGWADDYPASPSEPDGKFDSNDSKWNEYNNIKTAMNNEVISYTKNAAGYITEVTLADYNTDKFVTKAATGLACKFDAENSKFVIGASNKYVDEDAILFFIDSTNKEESYVGGLADLEDANNYDILNAYADNKADSINILVIDQNDVEAAGTTSNLAVITGVGVGANDDSEEIYEISYILNGEEKTGKTTAEAATDVKNVQLTGGKALTAGDIVKIKVGSNGLITNISVVWDFNKAIRTANTTSASPINGAGSIDELLFGGVVTNYVEKTSETTVAGKTVRLDKAANVYVVDVNGLNTSYEIGGEFTYFEELYTDNVVDIKKVDGSTVTGIAADKKAAYGDYVYVRTYEDKPTDVIIIKSMLDEVDASTTKVNVRFDKNGADAGSDVIADMVVTKGATITFPAIPDWTKATKAVANWANDAAGTTDYAFGATSSAINGNTVFYAEYVTP